MSTGVRIELTLPTGRQMVEPAPSDRNLALSEILRRRSIPLNTRCGQKGLCDGCMVELTAGCLKHHATGEIVTPTGKPLTLRACEYHLADNPSPVKLTVFQRSILAYQPQVVDEFRVNLPAAHDPLVDCPVIAAVDIGTTTVAVLLLDTTDQCRVISRTSAFNRQMHMGDDVLTRINLCATDPTMLENLHDAVTGTIIDLLGEAIDRANVQASTLGAIVLAGNTTMLSLAAAVDPSAMGVAPFTPPFLEHRQCRGSALNLQLDPATDPQVHFLPGGAAYIGADLIAGIVASGLHYADKPSLLVDVGTNGEIILKHDDQLLGCATAAGPAFEGSRLASGMRAGQGAISHITFHADPLRIDNQVIGDARPVGICGSAYLDYLARGRAARLLSETGRLSPDIAAEHLLGNGDYGKALRIARGEANRDIVISETDVASLLQAKAAIAAGIATLLQRVDMAPADIDTLYLAGGFGLHMEVQSAIGCGLLPGFTPEQVQVVGNTALAGAYLAAIDRSMLDEMADVARRLQTVELNLEPDFEMTYIEHLSLP